jgi:hypothetical protein
VVEAGVGLGRVNAGVLVEIEVVSCGHRLIRTPS